MTLEKKLENIIVKAVKTALEQAINLGAELEDIDKLSQPAPTDKTDKNYLYFDDLKSEITTRSTRHDNNPPTWDRDNKPLKVDPKTNRIYVED